MMKWTVLFLLLLFSGLQSQQKQETAYNFPKIESSVNMSVKIPLLEMGNLINGSLNGLLYEDRSFTDNNNDQFKVKVWKTRPIRLVGGTQQNLLIEVPLKIWAEKGVGSLGIYSYQNTTFETVMYFNAKLQFNKNWSLTTTTAPMGFKWVTKPELDFGKIKIPITGLVENSLKKQQVEFSKKLDGMMKHQLNFQPYAVLAWNSFAEPFLISEEFNTWLKITPLYAEIAPLIFYGDQIETAIGIHTYSETFTGKKPPVSPLLKIVPDFKTAGQLPEQFRLQTTANIPFSEATLIAEKMFNGKEFDLSGRSKVRVTSLSVKREEHRLKLEIVTEGTIDGVSIITGIPVYDKNKRKIVLTETKFTLKSKNILQKTAALLFQGKIVKMIEDEYGIPTADLEDFSQQSVEKAFNKEYYKGLKMHGKVTDLRPDKIYLSEDGISVIINSNAELKLDVKGL